MAGQWCWSTALTQTDEMSTRVVVLLGQVASLAASLRVVAALSLSMLTVGAPTAPGEA